MVCDLGPLAVNAVATVILDVTVVASNEEREIVNVAWANVPAAGEYDPDLYDNGSSATVKIFTGARLYPPLVLRHY